MTLYLLKEDVRSIGHTIINDNGTTTFVCSKETSGIEHILLRNILKCFGSEFAITEIEDTHNVDFTKRNIIFRTNLPHETYSELDRA